MKKIFLFLSIITASGLFMITIYNSVVDAASWGASLPSSIQTARDYYKYVDPRLFFSIIAPINQLALLLVIILFWKDSVSLRYFFVVPFLLYAFIFLLTILYFVPRDSILFSSQTPAYSPEKLQTVLKEWQRMNWVRSLIGLTGILLTCKGLDVYYNLSKSK